MAGRDVSFQQEWIRWGRVQPGMTGEEFAIELDSFDPAARDEVVTDLPTRSVPIHQMNTCLLVDPAPSEESDRRREPGSRNALIMVGIDPFGRKHVLDLWVGRSDPLDVIRKMLEMLRLWQSDTVAIEKVVFSVLYRHWLQQEADRQNFYVRTLDLEPQKRSKDTRINALIPAFRQGLVYLNRQAPDIKELVQELLEYPYGRTRDLLDALAYGDDVLRRPESPDEQHQRMLSEQGNVYPFTTRDRVTGY
jgi:predicted phage terminase large subunit-like protein